MRLVSEMEIPMAIVLFSAFLGPVVGPIAGGYIAQQGEMGAGNESWRRTMRVMLFLASTVGAILVFIPETAKLAGHNEVPNSYLTAVKSPILLLSDPILLLLAVYLSLIYGILCV